MTEAEGAHLASLLPPVSPFALAGERHRGKRVVRRGGGEVELLMEMDGREGFVGDQRTVVIRDLVRSEADEEDAGKVEGKEKTATATTEGRGSSSLCATHDALETHCSMRRKGKKKTGIV